MNQLTNIYSLAGDVDGDIYGGGGGGAAADDDGVGGGVNKVDEHDTGDCNGDDDEDGVVVGD